MSQEEDFPETFQIKIYCNISDELNVFKIN